MPLDEGWFGRGEVVWDKEGRAVGLLVGGLMPQGVLSQSFSLHLMRRSLRILGTPLRALWQSQRKRTNK